MVTHLERLKKVSDSGSLDREDWLLLQKIISQEQSTLKPCLCQNPCKPGSVMFSKDMKKTFSNRNHAAYGLGEVYIRFKCTAEGCNTSFSAMTLLIRYHERNQAKQTSLGIKRKLSPNTDTPISDSNSNLWSDCVEGLPLSSQPSAPTQNTDAQESQPTQQSQSQSFLVTQLPQYDSQESRSVTHQSQPLTQASQRAQSDPNSNNDSISNNDSMSLKLDSMMEIMISFKSNNDKHLDNIALSLQVLTKRNYDLESKLESISQRLLKAEAELQKLQQCEKTPTINPSLIDIAVAQSSSNVAQSSSSALTQSSSSALAQSSSLTHPFSYSNTWAAIAKAPPVQQKTLAQTKAKESLNDNNRSEGMRALSELAAPPRTLRKEKIEIGKTSSIYLAGFQYMKLRFIWSALRTAKFQTSRLASVQWIGKSVVEIIIADDYKIQFSAEISTLPNFRIVSFDPSTNMKAIDEEQNECAMKNFSKRCIQNIFNPNNSDALIAHFKAMASKYCDRNPRLNEIYSKEYSQALSARKKHDNDLMQVDNDLMQIENRIEIIQKETETDDDSESYCSSPQPDHHGEEFGSFEPELYQTNNATANSTAEEGSSAN